MDRHHEMKRLVPIVVLVLAGCGSEQERLAERALREGAALYNEQAFQAADSAFAEAPFDARAVFDRGNANYRLERWTEAISHFREATTLDSSAHERGRAHYNLASAHLAEAILADTLAKQQRHVLGNIRIDGEDIATKVSQYVLLDSVQRDVERLDALVDSSLLAAKEGYRQSLRVAPEDEDARFNLAYTQRLLSQRPGANDGKGEGGDKDKDKELSARAKKIMERADELVEQYRFVDALQVLQQGLKEDPSLKAKKEYMDKLDVVTKAARAT